MKKLKGGGGWPAIWYTLKKSRQMGGFWKLWKAMRSKNACKTCALGLEKIPRYAVQPASAPRPDRSPMT